MARYSANSLKGKIWLATVALACFVCIFGISSWLIVSLFTENSFYVVLLRLLFTAAAIMVYGWWLSNEVVYPIEKVSLLAKSLERGNSTSLPKTSGSLETDELLETLHRNSQQLQHLVSMMDKVSSGNLDVALAPIQSSDRLSSSFQRLLVKVTESINAKQDLEQLKAAISQITEETSEVRNGNYDVEFKTDFTPIREITETMKFAIHRLRELTLNIKSESKQTQNSAKEVQKTIQIVIGAGENRVREMQQATRTLKQVPQAIQNISEELLASSRAAVKSIEQARSGSQTAQRNLSAVNALRGQIRESVKRIGRLGAHKQEIDQLVRTMEDLAQRTNMIHLNASIQTPETADQKRGLITFTEEMERLAARVADSNKQISTLDKTIAAEIGEIERSLAESVSEAANLSKYAIETGSFLSELEKYIGQFLNLQEKLVLYSGEQSAETELAFQSFVDSITETENAVGNLKESERQIAKMTVSMENLQVVVGDHKTSSAAIKEIPATSDLSISFEPEFQQG